jgi:hypothetical protein
MLPSPHDGPQRQSISEAGAYRIVAMVFRDFEAAARILGNGEAVTPDPERALYLEAICSAIAELRTRGPAVADVRRVAGSPSEG